MLDISFIITTVIVIMLWLYFITHFCVTIIDNYQNSKNSNVNSDTLKINDNANYYSNYGATF
jgi:hypothetical protein